MSVTFQYFVAPSDADAEGVVLVGPSGRYASTDGSGIEPTVNLGQFEEMLTGKTFDQQLADPHSYALVASANEHHLLVIRIEPGFVAALAATKDGELTRLAEPWAQIEEFADMAPPDALADFLFRLRELAAHAVASGAGVYCWVCV